MKVFRATTFKKIKEMKKYQFAIGDGMSCETSTPEEREKAYKELIWQCYPIAENYRNCDYSKPLVMTELYGFYCSSEYTIKRDYTYQEMINLIKKRENNKIGITEHDIFKAHLEGFELGYAYGNSKYPHDMVKAASNYVKYNFNENYKS